ncbi:uncharacterized protein FYW61_019771 [Anableps anableps]
MPNWRSVPLLLVLVAVLCPAAEGRPLLDVNNTLEVYQAEEHSNVTLSMLPPVSATSGSLHIDLSRTEPLKVIYRYDNRVQPEPYTDEQFKGRLQCDPQLVGSGQIECLLADLRPSDAGFYWWTVATGGRRKKIKLEIKIRAVMPQTQEEPPKKTEQGRIGMYVAVGLLAVVILYLACLALLSKATTFWKFYKVEPSCAT